jgi:hypothetical protein
MAPDDEMNNLSNWLPCWTAKRSATRKQVRLGRREREEEVRVQRGDPEYAHDGEPLAST